MKNFLFVLIVMISCKSATQETIDWNPIVLKAKETSLYTNDVDWNTVNAKFIKLIEGSKDMKDGLQYLLNSLGDKHGQIRSISNHSIVVAYNGEISGTDNRRSDFYNNVVNDVSANFSYKIIDNDIGYLKVVGIGPGVVKDQADEIRNGLIDLKSKGVGQWIVDLRFNGGGNIDPMISGLAPLIGEGFIGGAINYQNEIRTFKIENGQFYNYNRLTCDMNNDVNFNVDEKVVVLLSRYTISSGEMLAITFKGRKNTLFVGEETTGYTTGNGYDPITDELALVISQDVFIDRNKNKYIDKVGVDEFIDFQHNIDLEDDLQMERAKAWLER